MKTSRILNFVLLLIFSSSTSYIIAQIDQGVYTFEEGTVQHELKVAENYLIHSVYEKSPAKFVKTLGGFYTIDGKMLKLKLEFNSDYQKDSLKTVNIPFKIDGDNIVLEGTTKLVFEPQESNTQDLDGQWLFGTRGPDKGQERRGDSKIFDGRTFSMDCLPYGNL